MSVEVSGIAHIQMTAIEPASVPFWEKLCQFLEMKTLIKADDIVYCIGSRTGILVRVDPAARERGGFDQNRAGLHHLCFRARQREDVDAIGRFVADELRARIVHPPEDGPWSGRPSPRGSQAAAEFSRWTESRIELICCTLCESSVRLGLVFTR